MKRILFLLTLAVCMVVVSACASAGDTNGSDENETPYNDNAVDDVDEEVEDDAGNTEVDEEYVVSEGMYHKQMDRETIEVEINDEIKTFKLSDEAKNEIDELETGEEFSFMHHPHNKHHMIDAIKEKDYKWHDKHHEHDFQYDRHHYHYDKKHRGHKGNHHKGHPHHHDKSE